MLASITPLGERGRQAHWGVTITAFALGAAGAGALAGAGAGAVGEIASRALAGGGAARASDALGAHSRLAVLAVGLLAAIMLDAGARPVPGPRRQVDERWLDDYRGWVYGLGFGAQLGLGVTTVVTSAATYVALLAALLTADPLRGAVIVGCYGAIRGLTPLAAAGVRAPGQLLLMHRRLDRGRGATDRACMLVLVAIFALAVAGTLA